MSKKAPSAPAPDPRLVDAQIQSMGVENDAVKQMLGLAERQQATADELAPMQKQAMQFALQSMQQGVTNSEADRAYALERRGVLTGLQDKMVSDAQSFDPETRGRELAGRATSTVEQNFNGAMASASRELTRLGVNPNDGRFGSMVAGLTRDKALAKAGAATNAQAAARLEGYGLTDRAANALAGYPAMTMTSAGTGAQIAGATVPTVNAGVSGIQAGYGAAGAGYGGAANAAAAWGGNATNMWNAQANYQVNSDRNSGFDFGGFGALLGGAAKLYPVLKGL